MRTCPYITYSNGIYTMGENKCGFGCGAPSHKGISKAITNDQSIQIYVRVLFVGTRNAYYSDYQRNNLLEGVTFSNINNSDYLKGALYKLTFIKENENYIFESSEPVV